MFNLPVQAYTPLAGLHVSLVTCVDLCRLSFLCLHRKADVKERLLQYHITAFGELGERDPIFPASAVGDDSTFFLLQLSML